MNRCTAICQVATIPVDHWSKNVSNSRMVRHGSSSSNIPRGDRSTRSSIRTPTLTRDGGRMEFHIIDQPPKDDTVMETRLTAKVISSPGSAL